jgi:hypothetical protein
MKTWIDEQTGRQIRQLTHAGDSPRGAALGYFRAPKHVPGGWMVARRRTELAPEPILVHPESGEIRPLKLPGSLLRLRPTDGTAWLLSPKRELLTVSLPSAEVKSSVPVPAQIPGHIIDITCDGQTLILTEHHQDLTQNPIPRTMDINAFWAYVGRPRRGAMWSLHLPTEKLTRLIATEGVMPFHQDTCPADPTLLRYAIDIYDAHGQRAWLIRTTGDEPWKMRPQEYGELVTHEFWWADGKHVGYTFQDRRGDETMHTMPWAEYSPRASHLGIADVTGKEVYLSDPLNSYHTHLFVSRDGRLVSGSGTDRNTGVFASRFSFDNPRIAFEKLASIHTPYVPFRGQGVNADFSADGKWMVYSDTIDGVRQMCAVAVDLA